MKTTFLLSLLFALFSLNICAEQMVSVKQINLKKSLKGKGQQQPGTRSLEPLNVFAYFNPDAAALSINLDCVYTDVTVSVKSILTGETIQSELYFTPMSKNSFSLHLSKLLAFHQENFLGSPQQFKKSHKP